jgi:thiol-disulfide isomerase/thioredoxin
LIHSSAKVLKSILLVSFLALPIAIAPSAPIIADEAHSSEAPVAPTPFKPSANVMADVDAVLARAKSKDKLGLIIMGANWCHDSQALVRRLGSAEMAPILDGNYETLLVDVAELNANMSVAQRFGLPVIYGTPTVLIIDPKTQKLVNAHNMHQWRDAESISMADTTAYFTKMSRPETRGTPSDATLSAHFKKMLADIDAFEEAQSLRLYDAFKVVGPMLKMEKQDRPDNAFKLWVELSKYRYQITKDLAALKAKVRSLAAADDTSATLDYPQYAPFSWEE